ncbi:MAG: M23 family metallopeptidase [Elusimicrobia bacterium]|nr:M23 family metallopeptidase [Elusimicrobiota bacterium]
MNPLKTLLRELGRHVTVLVIPHTDLPVWRARFSLHFLLFSVALWTGVTVVAGFVLGRHGDYMITKADNQVMRAKMLYLASEVERSRDVLEMARATDQQMRVLLGMQNRRAVIETEEGVGGPGFTDRLSISRLLAGNPARTSQPELRRSLEVLRLESQKRVASFQEIAWHISNERSLFRATPNIWPTEGRVTSRFGYRFSPIRRTGDVDDDEFHAGIDVANDADTPIFATADGIVRHAGWSGGYGRMVLLDHGWGYSTVYGHASKVLVHQGERVQRGRLIAYMGTTGHSTGNHLHYEVLRHGRPVNPIPFLKRPLAEEPPLR